MYAYTYSYLCVSEMNQCNDTRQWRIGVLLVSVRYTTRGRVQCYLKVELDLAWTSQTLGAILVPVLPEACFSSSSLYSGSHPTLWPKSQFLLLATKEPNRALSMLHGKQFGNMFIVSPILSNHKHCFFLLLSFLRGVASVDIKGYVLLWFFKKTVFANNNNQKKVDLDQLYVYIANTTDNH